jgi:hypothetical protein
MSMLAAHQEQVVDQVEAISSHQQVISQMILDVKEEVLALQGGEGSWTPGEQQLPGRAGGGGEGGQQGLRRRSVRHSVDEAVDATMQEMFACSPSRA